MIKQDITKLIGITGYDTENNCYLTKYGYLDIIQIITKDLVNSSEDEVEYDCLKFAKLYKLYGDDIKIIAMNFPCNTEKQQDYIQYKLQKTSNEIYKRYLQRKLDELVWLGKHDTSREYYFMLFAEKLDDLEKNLLTMTSTLGKGKTGLLNMLPEEKKHQILQRMANKCLLIN
ncbi:MAG: hypothetical protein J6K58_06795 [Lachnospiraceae bacterium]|nr:hypothetical protein [Lachnospiraceae bacterium]MBP3458899.1 hypothetical protein [Lachnospiraceae bacterium]